MAITYLRHSQHGTKVAISDMEADNDIQNGWEVFTPGAEVSQEPSAEPVNELPRRRGRRPKEATE